MKKNRVKDYEFPIIIEIVITKPTKMSKVIIDILKQVESHCGTRSETARILGTGLRYVRYMLNYGTHPLDKEPENFSNRPVDN